MIATGSEKGTIVRVYDTWMLAIHDGFIVSCGKGDRNKPKVGIFAHLILLYVIISFRDMTTDWRDVGGLDFVDQWILYTFKVVWRRLGFYWNDLIVGVYYTTIGASVDLLHLAVSSRTY